MAEVSIRPEEIRDALAKHVAAYKPGAAVKDEIGSVTQAGDGIARVEGLPSTMTNELLKFENGTLGLALNLDLWSHLMVEDLQHLILTIYIEELLIEIID